MSERAPPPLGHHPNWLPFIAAVELVLRQVGDANQAMKIAISALNSGVHSLVIVHGVRRLVTKGDKFQIEPPIYWDDNDEEKLTNEWRDETTVRLNGELVPLFAWRPELEEFLGLRSAAAREETGPRGEQPEVEAGQPSRTGPAKKRPARKRPPRHELILEILLREYPNGFREISTAVLMTKVAAGWDEACKARGWFGNVTRGQPNYPVPGWDTINNVKKLYDHRRRRLR
jgi:hypothetical protein